MGVNCLHITLLSETTPGKGGGAAGEVDMEISHDQYGLPVISGRTIQGFLRHSWQNFVQTFPELADPGRRIFGHAADNEGSCIMRLGDGELPDYIRLTVKNAVTRRNNPLGKDLILLSLTGIRHQTAQDRSTGTPKSGSLRASRVLIPGLTFVAPVNWLGEPSAEEKRCLAMSALGARCLGSGTTRGRGYIRVDINGNRDLTMKLANLEVEPV